MTTPDHDQGIEHEPHMWDIGDTQVPDPSETKADDTLQREARRGHAERLAVMHSVTEEPFTLQPDPSGAGPVPGVCCARCGYDLRGGVQAGCPECGFDPSGGYGPYLKERIEQTPPGVQWFVLLFALATGGVLSVLGSLFGQLLMGLGVGLIALAVTGPLIEELMKAVVVLMLIELRPYVFRSVWAIWAATLGSAAVFATLENLLYLNVYIPDPGPGIILWRWTACSALHVGCTAIATVGLVRMWRNSIANLRPPSVADVYPFLVAAIVVHGAYNAVAVLVEFTGLAF